MLTAWAARLRVSSERSGRPGERLRIRANGCASVDALRVRTHVRVRAFLEQHTRTNGKRLRRRRALCTVQEVRSKHEKDSEKEWAEQQRLLEQPDVPQRPRSAAAPKGAAAAANENEPPAIAPADPVRP